MASLMHYTKMNHQISPQYITKDKISVTILDMVNPGHFVVKESADLSNPSSNAKKFLEAEEAMQKFYASVEPCFFQLPLKDSIVVVLHKDIFYRAKVIRILTMSAGHLFKVYLVDYGIECSVSRENIYQIEKDFLHHPFQAVNIKLLGLEPISLIMNKIDLTMSYGPVSEWDPSVTIFIKDLQKSMCSAYIEVQGIDNEWKVIYGRLYVGFESTSTICVNDELVAKSFARFNEDCWKNLQKLESLLDDSTAIANSETAQSKSLGNVESVQVPCNANLSETESDNEDMKVMFINPADGKILAESSVNKKRSEKLSMEEDSQLQGEIVQAMELSSETPAISKEKTPEAEAQLLKQKHFQKLLNKKKRQSTTLTSNVASASSKNLQIAAIDKFIPNPVISCENSCTNIFSNEGNSQNIIDSHGIVNASIKEDKNVVQKAVAGKIDSSANHQTLQENEFNLNCDTLNQSELTTLCKSEINALSSCESKVLKDTVFEAKEKAEVETLTPDQLIIQKRFMKLQQLVAKRKSLSPIKPSTMGNALMETSSPVSVPERSTPAISCSNKNEDLTDRVSAVNDGKRGTSVNELEVQLDRVSDKFSNQTCQSPSLDQTVQESSESLKRQESEFVPVSANLRQLQRLQKKVRSKHKKESLQVLQKPSSVFNQFEELSVNTSLDSSLCDSDSGLNSFSSSPSPSDRIEY